MVLLIQTNQKLWRGTLNRCVVYDITKWISTRLKWLYAYKVSFALSEPNWMGCRRRLLWSQKRHATPISFDLSLRDSFSIKLSRRLKRVVRLGTGDRKWEKFEISFVLYVTWEGENEETEEAVSYQISVKNCLLNRLYFCRICMIAENWHEWKCDNFLLCVKDEGLSAYWF